MWVCKPPPTVKLMSCKIIPILILKLSSIICEMITIFVKYNQFRSVRLRVCFRNRRNAVLELQKYKNFLVKDPHNSPFLSMTVEINQEKLSYNCHTLSKIFNIEVPISGKIRRHPPPPPRPTSDVLLRPWKCVANSCATMGIYPSPQFDTDPALWVMHVNNVTNAIIY
jgi:hypothetical protein